MSRKRKADTELHDPPSKKYKRNKIPGLGQNANQIFNKTLRLFGLSKEPGASSPIWNAMIRQHPSSLQFFADMAIAYNLSNMDGYDGPCCGQGVHGDTAGAPGLKPTYATLMTYIGTEFSNGEYPEWDQLNAQQRDAVAYLLGIYNHCCTTIDTGSKVASMESKAVHDRLVTLAQRSVVKHEDQVQEATRVEDLCHQFAKIAKRYREPDTDTDKAFTLFKKELVTLTSRYVGIGSDLMKIAKSAAFKTGIGVETVSST